MHLEQGSVTHDNAKDVVEIVGNAACERAKALEFLGLHKLLLKPLSIGHIPDRRKHSLDIPFLFQWSGVGLPGDIHTVLSSDSYFKDLLCGSLNDQLEEPSSVGKVVRMKDRGELLFNPYIRFTPGHVLQFG